MKILFAAFLIFALSGLFWYRFFYCKERKLLNRLQSMISQAENGSFSQEEISETQVSALENQWKRYLDSCVTASENQQEQKSIIQGLISDISHQTLTPIANLKLYSELLQEEKTERSDIAGTIQEQTDKLDFLIQSLVKLSRMESGIISVHPKVNPISSLFEPIQREYASKAEGKNISFTVCKTALQAEFDLKWTTEALGNIVDNAIKYTNSGGTVRVQAEEYPSFIRINISDSGMGIDADEIPKIFTRFYRSLSAAEESGVGIGLYLAREMIRAQRGYIKVKSQRGRGSCFSVFLPRAEN